MEKIRVLVVDDSFFMRKMLSDILEGSGVIKVIGTAKDGVEALEQVKKLSPDVITLDVEMPKMNGLEALKEIMLECPIPVIMLSSLTKNGSVTTIKALELGAFDFIAKPSGAISLDIGKVKKEINEKIVLAYAQKEKWKSQWYNNASKKTNNVNKNKFTRKLEPTSNDLQGIIVIGTSTGGPKALYEVIPKISKNISYAILIVQHMPAGFTKSLADRLDSIAEINVVEAENNQEIIKGTAYIAPGDFHMTIKKNINTYKISLNQEKLVSGHRPSVDALIKSFKYIDLNKIYVIMTGMGSDGTKGIIEARDEKNDIIIAEDETSCIVYGMPKSIINKGLADEVVLLDNIADSIIESVNKQRRCQ